MVIHEEIKRSIVFLLTATIIDVDDINGITLANVNLADLHRDDVRFVA